MKKTLHQKGYFLNENYFEITEEGLSVKTRKMSSASEYFVTFDDMGTKVIKSNKGKKGWLIASMVFLILSIGLLFLAKSGGNADKDAYVVYLIFSVICIAIYLVTFKRSFYVANNDNTNAISFLVDKPSQQELNEFIATLKSERKRNLYSKYTHITKLLSYEQQYDTLNWLNKNEVLSTEEYNLKLAELNSLFSVSNPVIGFHKR
jgi:hypothetical protein